MLSRQFTIQLFLLLALLLVLPYGSVRAQSTGTFGDATFGMQEFRSESNGQSQKASSIYQQYTLGYQTDGIIHDARFGRYNLLLGYEFNALDPEFTINGATLDSVSRISTGKLYYKGEVLLAPGGLPFRLNLFAEDLSRSQFTPTPLPGYAVGVQPDSGRANDGHLITPDIYGDIMNGTHRRVGGTLLLGIRNGSYLGAYRDVLSQLPRLLIDYKQVENRDMHSSSHSTHNRARDLAFISLNKKDNWVHVRRRDFTDYINPDNDTFSQQIMIGTIDHRLTRQWINLTNWIKISGDLSYTQTREVRNPEPENLYTANLFSKARRNNFEGSIYSQFYRRSIGGEISQGEELPLSVRLDLNRDTALWSRVIYDAEQVSYSDGWTLANDELAVARRGHKSLYLDNMLELQRTRPIVMKPRIEFEARSEDGVKDGVAFRFNTEVFSNRTLNKTFNWLGGYSFTTSTSEDKLLNSDGSNFQNEIYGNMVNELSRNLRIGGRTSLTRSSGGGRQVMSFRIPTVPVSKAIDDSSLDRDKSGDITSGNLNLYFDHHYQRLANRLDLTFEFLSSDGITQKQSSLEHVLDYKETIYDFNWKNSVFLGDDVEKSRTVEHAYLLTQKNDTSNSLSWSSSVSYRCNPSRSAGFSLNGAVNGVAPGNLIADYKFDEEIVYRIFTRNGIIRRLAELSEKIGYESTAGAEDVRSNIMYGYFDAAFYPSNTLYGRVRWEVVSYLQRGGSQLINSAEIGFDFDKLKILASYKKGEKDRESNTLPGLSEQRWDFKVKKIF